MLLVSGTLLGAIAGSTAWTFVYDRESPFVARLAAGTCGGLAVLALAGFVVASALGVTTTTLVVAGLCATAPIAVFARREARDELQRELAHVFAAARHDRFQTPRYTIAALLAAAGGSIALWRVLTGAMLVRPDGIFTLVGHNFGDLPFHLAAITRFAGNQNLPPEHPSFAGVAFTYPFLADFLSAMLVHAGASLRSAVVIPALLGMFALVVLIHRWTLELTGDRLAAALAPGLVLLGGGLGWSLFVREAIAHAGNLSTFVAQLPHDFTIRQERWRWGNLITTLFVPQRGLQIALPLAVAIFRQWWLADRPSTLLKATLSEPQRTGESKGRDTHDADASAAASSFSAHRRMWAAGVLAGLLPLMHGHSYLVVMASAVCLTPLLICWGAWARFFAPAVIIGAPQVIWLTGAAAANGTSFVGWAVGWDRGNENAIVFWLLNTGVFIPLLVSATVWRVAGRRLIPHRPLLFYLPFALCFLVANVIRVAPWVWDNIKVLLYWWIASAPLVAMLLAHWFRRNAGWRALASGALLAMTLAGTLDVWRVLSGAAMAQVLDQPAVAFAMTVGERTEPGATILHAPVHNHPLVLSGRRSFMGYPGHLWTHGIDYVPRQEEIRRMYAGHADARALFDRYAIDYVIVGPDERRFAWVNDAFFAQYEVAGASGEYRLYRIRGHE